MRHFHSLRPIATLFAAILALPSFAQEQKQTSPQFTERINVRLVTLPVLVRDRQGRPVTDLKVEDVQITEGGKTHAVAYISPFYEGAEERKNLPNVRLMTQVPGGALEVAESTVREPRHLLILADLINDPPTGRKDAIDALMTFIETELDRSFQVAVMVYDGTLDLHLPFTHDRTAIRTALQRIAVERPKARQTTEIRIEQFMAKIETCRIEDPNAIFDEDRTRIGGQNSADSAFVDRTCLRDSMYEYAGEATPRASSFINALEAAVKYAAGLEDHTFILTLGGNVGMNPSREVGEAMRAVYGPIDDINQLENSLYAEDLIRPQLDRVMQLAYTENVSLSFLDRSTAPSDFSARQRSGNDAGFRPMITAFQIAQQDLDELAASTGGAFVASTAVTEGLRESVKLAEGGYYISFYVDDDQPFTRKRIDRVKLRSTRPGVTLKHRRAFEGVRKTEHDPAKRVRGIIQVGFPEEQEFQGVRGNIIPLRLVLDPRDLGYAQTEAQALTEFTVHLRLRTPKGALLADSYHVLKHAYPRDAWEKGQVDPPEIRAWADLPNGDYFAEAVVTVPSVGNRGTFTRHIAVRGVEEEKKTAEK